MQTSIEQIQRLSNDSKELGKDITFQELSSAVSKLKKDKSPGCDGLTAEFYQFLWSHIGETYYMALKEAIAMGQLHLSARRGIITLIPKKDRNVFILKNWRPLTMLTINYKILAIVLADRIKVVLPYLISEDQTGFMSGRQITTTIRRTMDIMDLANSLETPGYLICADFVKCFDLISYEGIRGSLSYFSFPERYIHYVDLLLNGFESCVTNNGYLSDWFEVTRSCHQGCPLAPYLMLICGETMAIMMKQSCRPLEILDIPNTIAQFADDTQLFTQNEAKDLETVTENFAMLKDSIGFEINVDKTHLFLLGGANPPQSTDFVIDHGYPKLLGIDTDPKSSQLNDTLNKARDVLEGWRARGGTLIGKVLIANTLVASLYNYILQCTTDPPISFYQQHEEIVKSFLWNGKRAKISMDQLKCIKKQGGLKLVDIKAKCKSLKIQWIFREDSRLLELLTSFIPDELGSPFLGL